MYIPRLGGMGLPASGHGVQLFHLDSMALRMVGLREVAWQPDGYTFSKNKTKP